MINHFHIYNRGAHKELIFHDDADYSHFVELIYMSNSAVPFKHEPFESVLPFGKKQIQPLVEIIAYCLMPNHFHIYAREIEPKNKTRFLRKLLTAYAMYYNLKYNHSGTIFQGACKSKMVTDNRYSNILITYIHLNPIHLKNENRANAVEKELEILLSTKTHLLQSEEVARLYLHIKDYPYSSLPDYLGKIRPQNSIIKEVSPR